jgi:hypothetical protein
VVIERILHEAGERFVYMETYSPKEGGWVRVCAANAYGPCTFAQGVVPHPTMVYFVECGYDVEGSTSPSTYVTIDHHRLGDGGYGLPPSEFLSASSLGQVIAELARLGCLPKAGGALPGLTHLLDLEKPQNGHPFGIPRDLDAIALDAPGFLENPTWHREALQPGKGGEWLLKGYRGEWKIAEAALDSPDHVRGVRIPTDVVLIAAADHCLRAAYQGECPGVSPTDLAKWRIHSRTGFQDRSIEDVLKDIELAKARLIQAPLLSLGESVSDMRGATCPELPEAAIWLGLSYIAGPLSDPSGREKIVCSGTAKEITAFFEWAKKQELTDAYGDPARGFAGAYISASESPPQTIEQENVYQCPRCRDRGKTWSGDPPQCAFTIDGHFSADNWNCATMNALRLFAQEIYCQDHTLGVIPAQELEKDLEKDLDGSLPNFLVLHWYKHRGACPLAQVVHMNHTISPLTLNWAELILKNLEAQSMSRTKDNP